MRDFWRSSGYGLLTRNDQGHLLASDDFMRAYLLRPEMAPPEEACAAERALHDALLGDPWRKLQDSDLQGLADPDARDNYRILLAFRDLLHKNPTLEAAYQAVFDAGQVTIAPLFIEQLTHVILRGIVDQVTQPLTLRAGELFFRSQQAMLQDGQVLAADEEMVEMHAASGGLGDLGRLLVESNTDMAQIELDVVQDENAEIYWARSDRFDTVIDLTFGRSGLDALCRVMELWIKHFRGADTRIHPLQSFEGSAWAWHIGLDNVSSALLNDLYKGEEVEEARQAQLISLFQMRVRNEGLVLPQVEGKPIILALAMDEAKRIRLKPQNLLVNFPLASAV